MRNITIIAAKKENIENNVLVFTKKIDSRNWIATLSDKEVRVSFFMLFAIDDKKNKIEQTLENQKHYGLNIWNEDANGKKSNRTRIWEYELN